MPTYYDAACTGPPAIDGSESNACRNKGQPKEKVTRPLDRRTTTLMTRERVEKSRLEAQQNHEPEPVSPSPVASPKVEEEDAGHSTARSLTKEEKVQLINESANHPYLKRLLQGMHVLRDRSEETVRSTHSSQLRERRYKKPSTTAMFATPPPAIFTESRSPISPLPTPWEDDAPPPWVASKHSILNQNKNKKKKKRTIHKTPERTPRGTPGFSSIERRSEPSPFPTTRSHKTDVSEGEPNDKNDFPQLKKLTSMLANEPKPAEQNGGHENECTTEGAMYKGESFYTMLQGALTRLVGADASDTETPSPSPSSPTPVAAKQLKPRSRPKQMGNTTNRSKRSSVTPEKRGSFAPRPSYSPSPSPSRRKPLPSPGAERRRYVTGAKGVTLNSPVPGQRPVWRK